MTLKETIINDLGASIKSRDAVKTSCLRMLKTSIKNKEVELRRDLDEKELVGIISSMVRKGKEAAAEFRKGGRNDLAEKEELEIELLQRYLPRQLSRDELEERIRDIVSELSAQGPGDIGKVMKTAMARLAGSAQGKEVNEIVKGLLSQPAPE